jgi:hypothetical protein
VFPSAAPQNDLLDAIRGCETATRLAARGAKRVASLKAFIAADVAIRLALAEKSNNIKYARLRNTALITYRLGCSLPNVRLYSTVRALFKINPAM